MDASPSERKMVTNLIVKDTSRASRTRRSRRASMSIDSALSPVARPRRNQSMIVNGTKTRGPPIGGLL